MTRLLLQSTATLAILVASGSASVAAEHAPQNTQVGYKSIVLGDRYSKVSKGARISCQSPVRRSVAPIRSRDNQADDVFRTVELAGRHGAGDRRCTLLGRQSIADIEVSWVNLVFLNDVLGQIDVYIGQSKNDKYSAHINVDALRDSIASKYGSFRTNKVPSGPGTVTRYSPRDTIHTWNMSSAQISMRYFATAPQTVTLEYTSREHEDELRRRSVEATRLLTQTKEIEKAAEARAKAKRAKDI